MYMLTCTYILQDVGTYNSINDLQLFVNKRFTIYELFCVTYYTYIEQYAYNRKRIK